MLKEMGFATLKSLFLYFCCKLEMEDALFGFHNQQSILNFMNFIYCLNECLTERKTFFNIPLTTQS